MNKEEKYYLCFDVGLTGYFSIIKYIKNNFFEVIHSEKIQIELKEDKLYKTDSKTKSKAIIIKLKDVQPSSLTLPTLDSTLTDVQYITSQMSFDFNGYTFIKNDEIGC